MDPQPDAKRLSFNSRSQTPTRSGRPTSAQPPKPSTHTAIPASSTQPVQRTAVSPSKRKRASSPLPSPSQSRRKRGKRSPTPILTDPEDIPPLAQESEEELTDGEDEFLSPVRKSNNLPGAREPTSSTRRPQTAPAPPIRRDVASILDKIHGQQPQAPREAIRRGRGWAWSSEEEEFLITMIQRYGPAWADIARLHCVSGGQLEGRDQEKLKDKARNLKEKMIR